MTSLDPAFASEDIPADLVEAGTYASVDAGFEHGLVVLATGNSYWLLPEAGGHRLLVEPREADHIRQQLAKYDRESVGWPPAPIVHPRRHVEAFTPALWALATIAAYWAEVAEPTVVTALSVDRSAILGHGEWWRLFTALFLHADVGHLVSNLISGAFVFSAVTTTIGRWRGWALLGIAAVGGNALSLLSHADEYRSLGASTAIFGAVGLLTGHAIAVARQAALGQRWRAATLPLVSGLVVLSLYGAGGPNIDIGAHVCGFICGAVLGWFVPSRSEPARDSGN